MQVGTRNHDHGRTNEDAMKTKYYLSNVDNNLQQKYTEKYNKQD